MASKEPTFANGKICYIVIPSDDVNISSGFYEKVFEWQIRRRDDGSVSFDDGAGEVSGTWVTGRKANADPAMIIHIMVYDIHLSMDLIDKNGGKIIEGVDPESHEVTAKFSDPYGNIWGLYQHRQ